MQELDGDPLVGKDPQDRTGAIISVVVEPTTPTRGLIRDNLSPDQCAHLSSAQSITPGLKTREACQVCSLASTPVSAEGH